jgi:hypothetical protein
MSTKATVAAEGHESAGHQTRDDDDDEDGDDAGEGKRANSAVAPARASARAAERAERVAATSAAPSVAAKPAAASTSSAPVEAASASVAGVSPGAPAAGRPSVPPVAGVPTEPTRPSPGVGGPLSWAPPAGYTSYPVKKVTGVGVLNTVDGKGGDVLIQLSRTGPVGPVTIKNCRNAVLIGGEIQVVAATSLGGQDQRGVYVTGCTGTVHIEGVRINGNVAGSEADGIAVNAPKAVVQIQNVRVEGMRGGKSSNHADVFQPWGGVREFRIDRLTGSTNYQGLHIGVDLGPIGGGIIRNTNIASSNAGSVDHGGNFIWLACNAYPLTLDGVYVAGRTGRSFGASIWPMPGASSCPAVVSAGTAKWPKYTSLTGSVREGAPTTGDFVPAGSVGIGYSSPGYL